MREMQRPSGAWSDGADGDDLAGRIAGPLPVLILTLALALALAASATLAGAAGAQERARLTEGFYIVRTGDTLETLAQRFLGDSQRWREIWRLNDEVKDPHLVRPGQRLRILVDRLPEDAALLAERSRRVENQMVPLPWADAERGDVLRWRDSLRTYEASSAALRFSDDSELLVSEESLLFLDPSGPRRSQSPSSPSRSSPERIEIVVGQADLIARPEAERQGATRGEDSQIELVLGDTVLRPEPAADGALETRARRPDDGGARLMVYAGEGAVEAAGETVELSEGTGSTVSEGEPPSPPEELLDAPSLAEPPASARLATPRPRFAWAPLEGAAGYVVEVCRDPECALLVTRDDGLSDTSWRPAAPLPVGDFHWRVTARSASGLDGYPASARALRVTSSAEDTAPPIASVAARGRILPPRAGLNDRWILAPDASLDAAVADEGDGASGVSAWTAYLDGEEVDESTWSDPPPGPHEARLRAVDAAGNEIESDALSILVDDQPPVLRWGVEDAGFQPRSIERRDVAGPAVEWVTLPGRSQRSIRDPHAVAPWRRQIWTVARDPRQIVLRPAGPLRVRVTAGDAEPIEVVLGPERGLWLLAEDVGTREVSVFDHSLELAPADEGARLELWTASEDAVGNGRVDRVSLETVGKAKKTPSETAGR